MLKPLLLYFGLVHVGFEIALLLEQAIPILISALPDDLLVRILSLVPTKDAVPTMILSKRWRSIWTMVPALQYLEINNGTRGIKPRCIWRFIDGSLQHHKAHVLETLAILIGGHCPVNTDVGKWIVNAVDRRVRELSFFLSWSAEPTRLPTCLYTCDTLVSMGLYDKVLVDVPSPACFPSLKALGLYHVLYKDEDSIVRFLSSCPILKHLAVHRHYYDNVKRFKIKVPSLEIFWYECTGYKNIEGTLVIDSPALKKLFITYNSAGFCLIENKPRFEKATINVDCYLDNKFMRSISSLKYLELHLNFATVACCDAINFSKLMECKLTLANELDWLDPLMRLLGNSPNLKVVSIDQARNRPEENFPLSWNQPSSVPGCLSAHLEIFEWRGYRGSRRDKEIIRYILANSKCLKRAGIHLNCRRIERRKMMKELESMPRVSTSSQLLFSTQLEYLN
ncbi:hypothetical protein EUTSA_v10011126mg, partial [Eutrema salsugineum]